MSYKGKKKLTSLGINPVFFLDDYFFSSQWINQQRGNFHPFLWFDFFFACFSFSKMEQFFFVLFRHKKNWEKISYSNIKRCSNLTFFFYFSFTLKNRKKIVIKQRIFNEMSLGIKRFTLSISGKQLACPTYYIRHLSVYVWVSYTRIIRRRKKN